MDRDRLLAGGIRLQSLLLQAFGGLLPGRRAAEPGAGRLHEDHFERVLVVRPDEIGDAVLLSPFLRELRRNLPRARITLVVNPTVSNLVERCPHVDEVVVYDQRVPRRWRSLVLPWRAFRLTYRELRRRSFDLAITPRWDTDGYYAVLLGFFSGATHRVGYSERATGRKERLNRGFDRFFTATLDRRESRHEVERNLDLLEWLGSAPVRDRQLELWLGVEDEAFAEAALAGVPPAGHDWLIALHPGAAVHQRQWPLERFILLVRELQASYRAAFLVVGGPGDRELGRRIVEEADARVLDMTGRTTLRQTAALLKRCDLYVGNDTGPMHIAAAAGGPVVELSPFPRGGADWHWNSPTRFAPWGVPSRVLQPERPRPPCSDSCTSDRPHCIAEIPVAAAFEAAVQLLGEERCPGARGENGNA